MRSHSCLVLSAQSDLIVTRTFDSCLDKETRCHLNATDTLGFGGNDIHE